MAIRKIRQDGDDVLRVKCKQVIEITDSIRSLIDDMFETMYSYDGVGLAAPQIGIVKRIVVIDDLQGNKFAMINPVIIDKEGEQDASEGCLSIPGWNGIVKRPAKVTVTYKDTDNKDCTVNAQDFLAVVMCHEIDHLDGILYKDIAVSMNKNDVENNENIKKSSDDKRFSNRRIRG